MSNYKYIRISVESEIINESRIIMLYYIEYDSPVGRLTVASDEQNIVGLWIAGQKYFFSTLNEPPVLKGNKVLMHAKNWLDRYFAGKRPIPGELPLAPAGSEFRRVVWKILCKIPYGRVTTYGAVAKEVAALQGKETMSAQAIGGAVSHNPISIIIPCHRVVGADGSMTGYAGGIDKKINLLRFEGADISEFFIPPKGTAI